MIIVLAGESASGKSTIANLIEKNLNYIREVTYTTRPMRDGEINGVDYYFVSEKEFFKRVNNNDFIEYSEYRGWWYGTSVNLEQNDNKIVILTPAGVRALKKAFPNAITIYLNVDRRSRLIKALERGDSVDEAYRRNLSDVGQFDAFEREADLVIENYEYQYSADEILTQIQKYISERQKVQQ